MQGPIFSSVKEYAQYFTNKALSDQAVGNFQIKQPTALLCLPLLARGLFLHHKVSHNTNKKRMKQMLEKQNDIYVIIPHISEPLLLLFETEAGWTLPRCPIAEPLDSAAMLNQIVNEMFDLDVTTLYCAYDRYGVDSEDVHLVYALENHSSHCKLPDHGRWVALSDLSNLTLAIADHQPVLETWFRELDERNIPALRRPWARFGWFACASSWIDSQLTQLHYQPDGPIEQVDVQDWSCVLRVPTTSGNLYFKPSDSAFSYEPALTQALSRLWPDKIPHVLTIEEQRNWFLMEDAGIPLSEQKDLKESITCWEELVADFARLQIASIAHVDVLLAHGCPDRRLSKLPSLFATAFANTSALLIGKEMSEEEWERLKNVLPELEELCKQLADYRISEALHHDDLHGGNVMVNGNGYIFFDWAESAITHPFCSFTVVQRVAKYLLKYDQEKQERLRDAYLTPWTVYAPIEHLREAFELALRIGKLCRGLSWYRFVQYCEPTVASKYAASWPYWLRLFLGTAE